MNLAIEYLVRSKAIRNLLKYPCSLFLVNDKTRCRQCLTFKKVDEQICVKTWNLTQVADDGMPSSATKILDCSQIFDVNAVVPKDFRPIKYIEESTPSSLNSYNKPMSKDQYEMYWNEMLNTKGHRDYKNAWLWDSFARHFVNPSSRDFGYYRESIEEISDDYLSYFDRKEFISRCADERYTTGIYINLEIMTIWENWVNALRIQNCEGAAPELVFCKVGNND